MNYSKKSIKSFLTRTVVASIFVIACALPAHAQAATLFVSPSSGPHSVGRIFSVSFVVSSPSQAVNAVSGSFTFSNENLEVTSVSKSGSIFSLWVQEPTYSNSSGTGSFEGVILNPGYTGGNGTLVTYTFRVKAVGTGTVTVGKSSILANDGNGTDVFTGGGKGTYTLIPKVEAPQTEAPPVVAPGELALILTELPRDDRAEPVVKFKVSLVHTKLLYKKFETQIDQGTATVWEDVGNIGVYETPVLAPGKHTLTMKTLEHDANLEAHVDFTIEPLNTPTLLYYTPVNHLAQQPVVLYGTAEKGRQVMVSFKQGDKTVYSEVISVDDAGHFIFIIDKGIAHGTYMMDVVARTQNGAISLPTTPVTISIKRYAYVDLGFMTISMALIASLSLLLLLIASVCLVVLYRRLKTIQPDIGNPFH